MIDSSTIIYIMGALIPLIVSNVLHMVMVKKNGLAVLAKPINTKLFGANKTWRGFVFVICTNAIVFALINWPGSWPMNQLSENHCDSHLVSLTTDFGLETLGFHLMQGGVYGLFYVLFELPNSALKRALNIKPGEASNQFKGLFLIFDKTDSALGVSLVFAYFNDMEFSSTLIFFVATSATHILFSLLLTAIRVKKSF